MQKIMLIVCGAVMLLLGLLGVFLPILPTTPFVLIGAGCIGAAHPELLGKLERTPYFGEFIANYRKKSGISRKTRIAALCWLWGALALSAALGRRPAISLVLSLVGIAVSIHIMTIKRKTK